MASLADYPSYVAFRSRKKTAIAARPPTQGDLHPDDDVGATPQELLAQAEAENRAMVEAAARIELIDGTRLARLMVEHDVGVDVETRAVLYRVDEEFFAVG